MEASCSWLRLTIALSGAELGPGRRPLSHACRAGGETEKLRARPTSMCRHHLPMREGVRYTLCMAGRSCGIYRQLPFHGWPGVSPSPAKTSASRGESYSRRAQAHAIVIPVHQHVSPVKPTRELVYAVTLQRTCAACRQSPGRSSKLASTGMDRGSWSSSGPNETLEYPIWR